MKISVLGAGRWGAFLAWYHAKNHDVILWGKASSKAFLQLNQTRKNEYITMPQNVLLTSNLANALKPETIIISIGAQQLRELAQKINEHNVLGKTFILCMKGIDAQTGERLSQIINAEIKQKINIAVWVGPGHVQDFAKGIPNCMVVDSTDDAVTNWVVDNLNSDLIRLYKGHDLIGTEVGAAAKNVIGIAAGMLDGKGLSSLKGALMARGAREVARLIKAMGGNELSAYGLCHLGDYEATLFSAFSHNRRFGEAFIKNETFDALAEGVATSKALVSIGEKYKVELPICETVYQILYKNKDADIMLSSLFNRSVKHEFDE